jgi:hypothetical protein
MRLTPAESIELLKGVIHKLSDLNKSAKESDNYKDIVENVNYNRSMQSLERTIRNHIKVEHSLRMYVEGIHRKIENIKNLNKTIQSENTEVIQQLKAENEEFLHQIKDREEQIAKITSFDKTLKPNREVSKLLAMEIKSYRLEQEWNKLKGSYEGKAKQCERYRHEHEELLNAKNTTSTQADDIGYSEYYFHKYREKCIELRQLEGVLHSLRPQETRLKISNRALKPLRTKSKSPGIARSPEKMKKSSGISISQPSMQKTMKLISIYKDVSESKLRLPQGSKTRR